MQMSTVLPKISCLYSIDQLDLSLYFHLLFSKELIFINFRIEKCLSHEVKS